MSETTTITFSYTKDDTTVQDTHDIVVDKIPASLAISGASSVNEGGNAISLTATVTYTDATTKVVSIADWASDNPSVATIVASTGVVTSASSVVGDQIANMSCSYTEGDVTVNGGHAVTVSDSIKLPSSVVITGPVTVEEGATPINLVATVTYDDSSTSTVTTSGLGTWSSSDVSAATVGANTGVVTPAADVSSDTNVTLTFSYAENGQTVQDTHIVSVTNSAPPARTVKFGYGTFTGTDMLGSTNFPFTGAQDFFDQTFDQQAASNSDGMLIQVAGLPTLLGTDADEYVYIAIPSELGAPLIGDFYQVHDSAAGGMDGAEADQPPPGAVPYITFMPSAPPKITISVDDGNGVSDWHIYRTDFPVDPASKGKSTWDIQITNLPNI